MKKSHIPDCTWCAFYEQKSEARKVSKQKIDLVGFEWCSLRKLYIPAPDKPGRWCESYKRKGCDCPDCIITVTNVL
jgi:hypothetical protein